MATPSYLNSGAAWASFNANVTVSLDLGTGPDRAVLVLACAGTNTNSFGVTGVTVGGVAATLSSEVLRSTDNRRIKAAWLVGASVPSGVQNVTAATSSDGTNKPEIVVAVYDNVSAAGSPVFASALSTSLSRTVTSATGNLVAGLAFWDAASTGTPTNGATERLEATPGDWRAYAFDNAGAATTTLSATLTSPTPIWIVAGWDLTGTVPAATLGGNTTLDDVAPAGSLASSASNMTGGVILDAVAPDGIFGQAPGTITSSPFKNWSGTTLASTTIPKVAVVRVSDMVTVLNLTNQSTDGTGVLTITNVALVGGSKYLLVTCDATGAAFGCESYTAT